MNAIYTRLRLAEREEISRGIWANEKFADIARRIGRVPSAISREVWKNTKYSWCYRAEIGQAGAEFLKTKGRPNKLDNNLIIDEIGDDDW